MGIGIVGQISLETLMGAIIFLVFMVAIVAYTSSQSALIEDQKAALYDKAACDSLAQAIREVKGSSLRWAGTVDRNIYLSNDTLFVNYNPSSPEGFGGIYCLTEATSRTMAIVPGDLNISYTHKNKFVFSQ